MNVKYMYPLYKADFLSYVLSSSGETRQLNTQDKMMHKRNNRRAPEIHEI